MDEFILLKGERTILLYKGKFYWKLINNQGGIPYIAGAKWEGTPLIYNLNFKYMSNEINKMYPNSLLWRFLKKITCDIETEDWRTKREKKTVYKIVDTSHILDSLWYILCIISYWYYTMVFTIACPDGPTFLGNACPVDNSM